MTNTPKNPNQSWDKNQKQDQVNQGEKRQERMPKEDNASSGSYTGGSSTDRR